ncbi:MAG: hypothetical protein R2754_10165 [Microthrixaceae bacterium]
MKVEVVEVTKVPGPTEVVGSADGTLLIGERSGRVARIDPSGVAAPSVVVDNWCEGRLAALVNRHGRIRELDLAASVPKITSFGRGADGEIYAASERTGSVWRLVQQD